MSTDVITTAKLSCELIVQGRTFHVVATHDGPATGRSFTLVGSRGAAYIAMRRKSGTYFVLSQSGREPAIFRGVRLVERDGMLVNETGSTALPSSARRSGQRNKR